MPWNAQGSACPAAVDGLALVPWIHSLTGDCVYGQLAASSWTAGYLSVGLWICAQLPQIIANHRNSSVDGLSWLFLALWFTGDACNVIGCLLTHQLPFQTLLGCYYLVVDTIMISQYFYYTRRRIQYIDGKPPDGYVSPGWSPAGTRRKPGAVTAIALLQASMASAMPIMSSWEASVEPRMSVESEPVNLGLLFAWTCAILYLCSRIPQILKNYKRKSTEGLSIALFLCAMSANTLYTVSILTSPEAQQYVGKRLSFILNELPYIVGSAGTILFDIILLVQWRCYRKRSSTELLGEVCASPGPKADETETVEIVNEVGSPTVYGAISDVTIGVTGGGSFGEFDDLQSVAASISSETSPLKAFLIRSTRD